MVALDGGAGDRERFDAVGIYCALSEPFHIGELMCLFVKHVDKSFADDLAFLFGIGHSGEFLEELCRSVDSDHIEAKSLIVAHHVAELVLAEHAVVNEYAGEIIAYRLVEEHGRYRGIDTAAQAEHHLVVSELLFERGHGRFYERRGVPVAFRSADALDEVGEQLRAALTVVYFWVELHAPHFLLFGAVGGNGYISRGGYDFEFVGYAGDGVAMAHPHLASRTYAAEQLVGFVDIFEACASVFAAAGRLYLASVGVGYELRSVAYAQNGKTPPYR